MGQEVITEPYIEKIELLIMYGLKRNDIEGMLGIDLDEWCRRKYKESYEDLMNEIEYAKHPNQNNERPYTVYMHIAPSGKKYIGITKCLLNRRWGNGRRYQTNEYFSNAIEKYGWDSIQHAILHMKLTKEEAEQKERELIGFFQTNDRRYGYNIESGGSLNKEVAQSTREKLRRNAMGVHPSNETRRKMSESHKGERCHFYGIPKSEEHKRRLSEIKSKPVLQLSMDGKVLCEFNSMKEAARKYGVTRQAIRCACIGRSRICAGYKWRYK